MKNSTKKHIWELWQKIDSFDFEMDYFQKLMTAAAEYLQDPIPTDIQDDLFERVNTVGAFNNFRTFSNMIDESYELVS